MDQFTRRLIGFGVHAGGVDGAALCRMINQVISGQKPPSYLSSDHDPTVEYHRWQAHLRILESELINSVPYTPISHPFVESFLTRRCAGPRSICRESLTRSRITTTTTVFTLRWGAIRDTPAQVSGESKIRQANLESYRWEAYCRGLVQLPMAA